MLTLRLLCKPKYLKLNNKKYTDVPIKLLYSQTNLIHLY